MDDSASGSHPPQGSSRSAPPRHVLLIHGMGRSRASMWLLGRRLSVAGWTTSLFGYSVSREPFEDIVDRWVEHVHDVVGDGAEGWSVVGHSLGNLLTRAALPRLPEGMRSMVMLAPPNRSPAVARALERQPLFRLVARDTGARLSRLGWASDLPVPDVPVLIVAGTAGPRLDWLPFGAEPNDGLVTVNEARLEGAEVLEVPALHTFLMNRRDVSEAIVTFLRGRSGSSGRVSADPEQAPHVRLERAALR